MLLPALGLAVPGLRRAALGLLDLLYITHLLALGSPKPPAGFIEHSLKCNRCSPKR